MRNNTIELDKEDLRCAQIPFIHKAATEKNAEQVVGTITSRHGEFTVIRGRSYWMVSGKVPLAVAEKLYAHPEGRRSVRVAGHCMRPAPSEWVEYFNDQGKPMANQSELNTYSEKLVAELDMKERYDWVADKTTGNAFITHYHIDSQAGLLLFTQMIQE